MSLHGFSGSARFGSVRLEQKAYVMLALGTEQRVQEHVAEGMVRHRCI